MTDLVLKRDAAGVRTLTLNRPDRRNALDVALLEALRAALAGAAADPDVRCVVVTGAGKGFCARPADVDEWAGVEGAAADELGRRWEANAHALMQELFGLPKLTVALLNGAAVGAGLDLACCCDFRIASDAAKVACAYTWIGYGPDAGGTWLYPRLIRPDAAKRLVYTGEVWDARRHCATGWSVRWCRQPSWRWQAGRLPSCWAAGPDGRNRPRQAADARGARSQLRRSARRGIRGRPRLRCHRGLTARRCGAAAERRAPVFAGR